MKASKQCLNLVKKFESLRLKAYKCPAQIWTCGYGHTSGVKEGMTCTEEQADEWLASDITIAEHDVDRLVKVPLTQRQYDALCSWLFNLGIMKTANSTLIDMVNKQDFAGAAAQFSRWVYAGKTKLAGLMKRRAAERKLFEGNNGKVA
jgi:lysozyme